MSTTELLETTIIELLLDTVIKIIGDLSLEERYLYVNIIKFLLCPVHRTVYSNKRTIICAVFTSVYSYNSVPTGTNYSNNKIKTSPKNKPEILTSAAVSVFA